METASVIVGSAERRWIVYGPTPVEIEKTIWSGIEGAAFGLALVSTIACRSVPVPAKGAGLLPPLSPVLVTTNWRVLRRSWENSDVSPVPTFVAVAVTRLPRGRAPETAVRIVAVPLPSLI